jgi:hypothetical protein
MTSAGTIRFQYDVMNAVGFVSRWPWWIAPLVCLAGASLGPAVVAEKW